VSNDDMFLNSKIQQFFDSELFPYILDNKIEMVVHLGDLFDRKRGPSSLAFQMASESIVDFLRRYKALCMWYQIVGNHDIYYNNMNVVNAPKNLFRGVDRVEIIEDTLYLKSLGVVLCGWNAKPSEKAKYLFGHFVIKGFEYQKGVINMSGDEVSEYENWKYVFSGHFHRKNRIDNVIYVGSNCELRFGEEDVEHGFYILDTDMGKLDFVESNIKIFQKLYYDESGRITYDDIDVKDKIVKVVAKDCKDMRAFDSFCDSLMKAGAIEIRQSTVESELKEIFSDVDFENIENITSFAKAYIDELGGGFKKDKLLELFIKLYKKVGED